MHRIGSTPPSTPIPVLPSNPPFSNAVYRRSREQDIPLPRTPASALGTLALLLGAAIHWLSYRELGRHFTFHVSILKDHRLITTGPYSVVRHPGYTGGALSFLGMVLWYAAPSAWMRESGIWGIRLAWMALVPIFSICVSRNPFLAMWRRMPKEDAILRDEFGKEWDLWASNVRYRIIPLVY